MPQRGLCATGSFGDLYDKYNQVIQFALFAHLLSGLSMSTSMLLLIRSELRCQSFGAGYYIFWEVILLVRFFPLPSTLTRGFRLNHWQSAMRFIRISVDDGSFHWVLGSQPSIPGSTELIEGGSTILTGKHSLRTTWRLYGPTAPYLWSELRNGSN